MKLIDLTLQTRPVDPIYLEFISKGNQLFVYYSNEEFKNNVFADGDKQVTIINNINDLHFLLKKFKESKKDFGYEPIRYYDEQVWIATGETIVPNFWTPTGEIIYKLDEFSNIIRTDNCYVRLIGIKPMPGGLAIYTSSGIYHATLFNWSISAAIKEQFCKIRDREGTSREFRYARKLKKVLQSKRPLHADIRFIHYLINKDSVYYGKVDEALTKAYAQFGLRKEDRAKIFNTDRMRNLLFKELKTIMPDISDDIRKEFTGEKVAQYVKKMSEHALDKGTTKDQKEVLEIVLTLADYNPLKALEQRVIAGQPIQLIGEGDNSQRIIAPKKEPVVLVSDAQEIKPLSDDEQKKLLEQRRKELLGEESSLDQAYVTDN